jgi:hypothetical protein
MSTMSSAKLASRVRAQVLFACALATVSLVAIASRPGTAAPPKPERYLYVLGCGAVVDKLDTVTGRKLSSVDLRSKTDRVPDPQGHLDGCLANGVAYQESDQVFYTAVPTSAQYDAQGKREFRILSFAVPGLQFKDAVAVKGTFTDPPRLAIAAAGNVEVIELATRLNLFGYTGADLSPYRLPNEDSVPGRIVDESGDAAAVQLSSASGSAFAAANRKTKQVALLRDLPRTFPQNVHLAPAGAVVLVEGARPSPDGSEPTLKTGDLVLVSSASGEPVKSWKIANLEGYLFLAIAPNGKVVYHSGDRYRFPCETGASYPNVPVYREESAGPPVFFAAE